MILLVSETVRTYGDIESREFGKLISEVKLKIKLGLISLRTPVILNGDDYRL
jgi:hypothetical protein